MSVLIPRRIYRRAWHRLLHDRTADAIAEALAPLPHANVTIVPYHLGERERAVQLGDISAEQLTSSGGNGRSS
ncbi:hypothetical protein BH18ACT1_BH18ACT1_03170 [soil metagenome]